MNPQEYARKRAERIARWAESAARKSNEYYEKSNKHRDFLSLAEPIKVGHHSEKRHRKIISDSWDNMGKSVEYSNKADDHLSRLEYWEKRENVINLSMPESIEYYETLLEKKRAVHKNLKDNPEKRRHSYSLTYAKKEVNECEKSLKLAFMLWG